MNLRWYDEVKAPESVLIFGKLAYQQCHIQNNLQQRVTDNYSKCSIISKQCLTFAEKTYKQQPQDWNHKNACQNSKIRLQKQSDVGLCLLSKLLGWQLVFKIFEHLK